MWMHCNLRPPDATYGIRQSFSALIWWSRWTYPLPYYSIFAADTLLYAVTLTFDLWPWTFAPYRRRRDETMYQIWTQSNPRQSYCDFNIWPNELCLNYSIFDADTLSCCDLDLWPVDLESSWHQASRDQSLYEIWAKSTEPPEYIWW